MERVCATCRSPVKLGLHSIQLDCKQHYVHTKCINAKNPDFSDCAACRGDINEPTSFGGRDYVADPILVDGAGGVLTSIKRVANSALGRGTLQDSRDAFFLLSHGPDKCSIKWLLAEKNMGLQELLSQRVTMADFLANRYGWDQISQFKDIKGGGERARKALFSLRCNAEQFRDHSDLLPLDTIKTQLELTGRHMVELYGLHFPNENAPLSVIGAKNQVPWTAAEVSRLGLQMQDLFGAGLETFDQYVDLLPTDADEVALNVTDEDVNSLKVTTAPNPVPQVQVPIQVPIQGQRIVLTIGPEPVATPVVVIPPVRRLHSLRPNTK